MRSADPLLLNGPPAPEQKGEALFSANASVCSSYSNPSLRARPDFTQLMHRPFPAIQSFSRRRGCLSAPESTASLAVCLSSGFCHFLSSGGTKPSLITGQKNMSIWETPKNQPPRLDPAALKLRSRALFTHQPGAANAVSKLSLETTKCPLASEHVGGGIWLRGTSSGRMSAVSPTRPAPHPVAMATAADANASPLCSKLWCVFGLLGRRDR